MNYENFMQIQFCAVSRNEGFARTAVAAFISTLDPTIEEISDIKTAVSEAVTNAIIHGYENRGGTVTLRCGYIGRDLTIEISDDGSGIENIEKARQPLYTSRPELERSGMGFTVMEMLMDEVEVESKPQLGTTVRLTKSLKKSN